MFQMKTEVNIKVEDEYFYDKNMPTEDELKHAEEFARKMIGGNVNGN